MPTCGSPTCRDDRCDVPFGLCHCGCGEGAPVAPRTDRAQGWIKGQPKKFINGHRPKRSAHHRWRGGRRITKSGYAIVNVGHEHPMADANGNVLEHRLVMAQKLGRMLDSSEYVHHINEDKADNRPENLALTDNASHLRGHNAKLTEASVRVIKQLLAEGNSTQAEIAKVFGVTGGTISHINTGRWWKHVK